MNGKFLFAAAVTVMAAASCTKQLESVNTENNDVKLVPVSIQVGIEATKTSLEGYKVSWNVGDEIAVAIKNSDIYKLTATTSGNSATFTGELPVTFTTVKAFYPYELVKLNSSNATNFRATFPSEQKGVTNGIDSKAMPLVFNGDITKSVVFKPCCSLVRVTVAGNDINAIELELGSDNLADFLGGTLFNFNTSGVNTSKQTDEGCTFTNKLKLTPSEGTVFNPGNYYFPILPQKSDRTFKGVKLSYTKTDSNVLTRTSEKDFVVAKGKINIIPGDETDIK